MPVRRSLGDSGADAAGRKVRGRSKGSGDDVRTPRSKSTNVDKSHRKVRVAIEGSNGGGRTIVAEKKGSRSNGGDRTTVAEKKGSRKVQRRGDGDDVASYLGVNENSSEGRSGRKRDFKMKTGSEGFEAVIDGSSGRKRKRIHADPGMVEDRMSDGIGRKFTSKSRYDVAGSYMDKDKKVPRRKDGEFKDSDRNGFVKEMTRFRESESQDKKVRRSKTEGDDKQKIFQDNGLGNGKTKISSKKKVPLATQKEGLNQRRNEVDSAEKLRKKKNHGKKSLGADSDLTEGRPKKKKRVIRIDPYDISNKRLDDSIADNGNSKAKMDSIEPTGGEMSQNAQFRAICPSSSILSFVEANLLGRRRDIEFRRAGYNIELSAPLDNIPSSTSSERERIEVPAFRNKLEFFAAAKISSSFPPPDLPEIAFAGRSNVGKSSLLNALTRQWGVARTSDKPGLTQTINFFKLGQKLCLVDLPGYGFAYAKEEAKEAWEELVKEYVTTRAGLKRVCLLVDTKWGMKPRDHELIDLMERSQTKYQVVLTKTDLVFPIDVARRAMQIEENLKAKKSAVQPVMMVSSKTGAGIRTLRTVLANVSRLLRH